MMNNFMNLIQTYNQLRKNPMNILTKRFNIPNTVNMNDPNAIIQHLLNTNQVSQQQVNGFANEVDQLYTRLSNCPVPSVPVYGRQNIFQCNQNNGCGCGCSM